MNSAVFVISDFTSSDRTSIPVIMIALKMFSMALVISAVLAENNPETKPKVQILTDNSFVRQDGYNFEFKTSDGVSRKEEGNLITVDDHQGIGVRGTYSYVGADGQTYEVSYTADDKGFKPTIRIQPPQ